MSTVDGESTTQAEIMTEIVVDDKHYIAMISDKENNTFAFLVGLHVKKRSFDVLKQGKLVAVKLGGAPWRDLERRRIRNWKIFRTAVDVPLEQTYGQWIEMLRESCGEVAVEILEARKGKPLTQKIRIPSVVGETSAALAASVAAEAEAAPQPVHTQQSTRAKPGWPKVFKGYKVLWLDGRPFVERPVPCSCGCGHEIIMHAKLSMDTIEKKFTTLQANVPAFEAAKFTPPTGWKCEGCLTGKAPCPKEAEEHKPEPEPVTERREVQEKAPEGLADIIADLKEMSDPKDGVSGDFLKGFLYCAFKHGLLE